MSSLAGVFRAASVRRSIRRAAGVAIVLVLVALAFSPVAEANVLPTVTVKPDKALVGNQTFNIAGQGWSASSPVQVDLCGGTPASPSGHCLALAPGQPSRHGAWKLAFEPLVGAPPAVCQSACYVEASQGSIVADAALTVVSPFVGVKAHKGPCCYIGQPISVQGGGFPVGDTVDLVTCSSGYCDSGGALAVATAKGSVKFTGFGIDWDLCSPGGCYLQASDTSYGNGPLTAVLNLPVYCGPIACPPSSFGTASADGDGQL